MKTRFQDRHEAGTLLAGRLAFYAGRPNLVVLALPRGGVPVGHVVAQKLHAPLDVLVVRKLGVPGHEELAMGAIARDGVQVLNREVIDNFGLAPGVIAEVAAREERELARREKLYRGDQPPGVVKDKTVILVDDGIATGATIRAALATLRQRGAGWVVVAAPVIAEDIHSDLCREADEVVAMIVPREFQGVGAWYEDFTQTTDAEVQALLDPAAPPAAVRWGRPANSAH